MASLGRARRPGRGCDPRVRISSGSGGKGVIACPGAQLFGGQRRGHHGLSGLAGGATLLLAATAVQAETLGDALALAYASNPGLQAQRAQLQAINETYVQARAGWRPTATAEVLGSYSKTPQAGVFGGLSQVESNDGQASIGVTQPLYTGGRVAAEVRATEADVLAGREALRSSEASLLLQVISNFMDVLRDQALLGVHQRDVSTLQRQADDARLRLAAGEVTQTDVAQVDTQLAQSRTALSMAMGQLQLSRAAYAATVGQNPGTLVEPPGLPGLPSDVDAAFDTAERFNPGLRQAEIAEEASRARVAEARAADRPNLNVTAEIGLTGALTPLYGSGYDRALSATVTLTQPLFTGGLNASQIRRALDLNTSDRISIEASRRTAVLTVSQTWNQLLTQRASEASEARHVAAARAYFAGTQAEYTVGQRSTLDIIVAEQSLIGAEIALAQTHHDAYVAQASVLSAIGRLELRYLEPTAALSDPARAFRRVANRGAVPWEGLVAAVDNLGAPPPDALKPIGVPAVALRPAFAGVSPGIVKPGLPDSLPTAPLPNTTSPLTPETLGQAVREPADPLAGNRSPR